MCLKFRQKHRVARKAFTLVELLIIVAIVGILASITLVAVSPKKNITDANDALRLRSINVLLDAIRTYEIGQFSKPFSGSIEADTWYDICALGRSGDCLDFSNLVTKGYLATIPGDPVTKSGKGLNDYSGQPSLVDHTGYCYKENQNRVFTISALFLGSHPDEKQTTECDSLNVSVGYSYGSSNSSASSDNSGSSSSTSSDYCHQDTYGNLLLWLRADEPGSTLANGASVSTWYDQSGQAKNATQISSGSEPTYVTNAVNSLPAMRFDGTNDYFNIPSLNIPDEFTAIAVVKAANTTDEGRFIGYNAADNARFYMGVNNNDPFASTNYDLQSVVDDANGNNYPGDDVVVTDWMIATLATKWSAGAEIFHNRAAVDSIPLAGKNRASVSTPIIGAQQGAGGRFFNGDIAEILIYDTKLNASNREQILGCLITKYLVSEVNSCFLPGTQITLEDGSTIAIEEIQKGDRVLGMNPDTELPVIQEVTQLMTPRAVTEYFVLTTEQDELKVTGEHPFYVGNGIYRNVRELGVGDIVYRLENGNMVPVQIIGKEAQNDLVKVYNFETNGFHNYYANGILVHNKSIATSSSVSSASSASVSQSSVGYGYP